MPTPDKEKEIRNTSETWSNSENGTSCEKVEHIEESRHEKVNVKQEITSTQ